MMVCVPLAAQKDQLTHAQARELDHENPIWPNVASHLPNPATASAEQLESAADVLRARRFLEDALDYYAFALTHGGNEMRLLNKLGITELELRHPAEARSFFQHVVKVSKKNPEGWNNLGAIEYLQGNYGNAISDYKKAIKLEKTSASFHSNLATAYFDKKDFEAARKEFNIALTLDPDLMEHHGTSGTTTRMLSPADHARFCFELARLYAEHGNEEQMIHFLTMSSEVGFDVLSAMANDEVLSRYRKDPRVLLLVKNAKEMRMSRASNDLAPALPPPIPASQH
jgi:tetratricopeptide (TPR) repeat protein